MLKQESEHSEPLVHAEIDTLQHQTAVQVQFGALVDRLLKDAPNVEGDRHYATDYDKQSLIVDKAVEFKFKDSIVRASYYVSRSAPTPTFRLEIRTPIVVDSLRKDMSGVYRQAPYEIVEFKSDPHFRMIHVRVKAVDRLGDFGHKIPLDQYTAGGLLPPINVLGRGPIEAFQSVIALFEGVIPRGPSV